MFTPAWTFFIRSQYMQTLPGDRGVVCNISADSAPYDVVPRGLRRYIKRNREQGHLHRADVLFVLKKERRVLKYKGSPKAGLPLPCFRGMVLIAHSQNGISGCADGSFVLIKSGRSEHKATLHCTGRDIEDKEIGLEFRNKRWTVTDKVEPKTPDTFSFAVHDLMLELKLFRGTATEMCALMKSKYGAEMFPNRLTRDLVQHTYEMKSYGVEFSHNRSNGQRIMTLIYRPESDGSDGKILMRGDLNSTDPTVPVVAAESSQTLSQIETTAVEVNDTQSKVTDPVGEVTVTVDEPTDPVDESVGNSFIRMVAERTRNNLLALGIFVKPFTHGN